ncbi:MAG: chromosomal replication initiator protein DnaA [Clostridia bacterium]|nr:chromosomal replication initiator protein DnaA [Clostridia bacterium]
METEKDVWAETLRIFEKSLSAPAYNTWFRSLSVVAMHGDRLYVGLDDPFGIQVLKNRYLTILTEAVRQAFGRSYTIVIVNRNDPIPVEPENNQDGRNTVQDMLNPKYTFDTFVVGDSNRFAHAASLAVAEMPADAYNPLFLYGGVGLGKTHLMHAIGHHILASDPTCKLLYTTSESFTNEVIHAIQTNTTAQMRDKFRSVDVLMIDDIQFIAGKTSTQEEFFHTFNHLHSSSKQVIISSDRPPKDIPTLEERMTSRFEWGLIADIQKPDYETRVAILRKKAANEHIQVSDDVLNFIAEKVESNIRELEGSLTRVNAKSVIDRQPITLELAQESLSNIISVRDVRRITPEIILTAVAEYHHLNKEDLLSQRRNREIAVPRQIAMYLTQEMTSLSTTRMGDVFGGRDHTTIMHGCKKIEALLKTDPHLQETIGDLRRIILEG